MASSRNVALDIAKAICIILMVIGHSGCPEYLKNFIYMFHMPCFFFISGWLLNDRYLTDIKTGLWNKFKGTYFPFVKWSLLFLACHNIFAALNIYNDFYSINDFFKRTIRIIVSGGGEQLVGGFWFLISLCIASIVSLLFLYVLNRFDKLTTVSVAGGGNYVSLSCLY